MMGSLRQRLLRLLRPVAALVTIRSIAPPASPPPGPFADISADLQREAEEQLAARLAMLHGRLHGAGCSLTIEAQRWGNWDAGQAVEPLRVQRIRVRWPAWCVRLASRLLG